MKLIRAISFSLMGVIILLLIAGSIVEQFYGTAVAIKYVYTAPYTIALWALATIGGITQLVKTELKQWATILLHFSFVVILAGSLLTHLFGIQGAVELKLNKPTNTFTEKTNDYDERSFPFTLELKDFQVIYYDGTTTARDYRSTIQAGDKSGTVSMNNIFRYKGYRFYQSGFSEDMSGSVLLVSYDPYGIAVTYCGYALLLLTMVLFFMQSRTHFRQLLKKIKVRNGVATLVLLLLLVTNLNATPSTIPQQQAEQFGNLCVFYNDRLQPMSCLMTDFTEKIYGKTKYQGLTAEQVYMGWLLSPYSWLDEPMFKLKTNDKKLLRLNSRYATYYQLFEAKQKKMPLSKYAEEKMALVGMLLSGELTKIYPYRQATNEPASNHIVWYSQGSNLPLGMADDEWFFIKKSMDYVGQLAFEKDYARMDTVIAKLNKNQQNIAGDILPSGKHFRAEQIFRRLNYSKPLAMMAVTIGIILFIVYILLLSKSKTMPKWLYLSSYTLMLLTELFLTAMLSMRWYISGHIPMSNGHETMHTLAFIAFLLALIYPLIARLSNNHTKRSYSEIVFSWLIGGFALLVSMMSASNPQITPLMPVLQSPLLSIHVAVIMLSYALLFFIMLNSLVALIQQAIWHFSGKENKQATEASYAVSQILLYPAVFLLAIGIFIGAVWANISWGSYWQWDPKETWALITLLVYAGAIHTRSIKFLQNPTAFHLYCVLAFLFVLFTYFGVNFILGGMHSYA